MILGTWTCVSGCGRGWVGRGGGVRGEVAGAEGLEARGPKPKRFRVWGLGRLSAATPPSECCWDPPTLEPAKFKA